MTSWEDESYENVYQRWVECGVVEWVKRNTLRRKKSEEFVDKESVYE